MKAQSKINISLAVMCLAFGLSVPNARAFSLLGPVQPWMQSSNGVIFPGDIGGPMSISNGYRWNVPVVTYGFDQSFLDFFGTNGVAAVESAIQILNDLPPASQIALTNYPFDSRHLNYTAQAQSLSDLKSQTLSLLLEHLGLAQPTRNIYVLRQWNLVLINESALLLDVFHGTNISGYVITRNYDPQDFNTSPYVNETLYSGQIYNDVNHHVVVPFPADPFAATYNAVADNTDASLIGAGVFYTGLTCDDVGGLAYLLSTNNVDYETLLADVQGVGTNLTSFVHGAWRPGVDKITFVPQTLDLQSGAFLPMTNYFTDSYITNGILAQQPMARVVSQPDFVFSAGDVSSDIPTFPFFSRTGTTNWLNNATANGNADGAGPGVIQPQVQIVFNRLGRQLSSFGNISDEQIFDQSQFWASFDGSTNAPVVYPIPQSGTNQLTVRMWITFVGNAQESFGWKPRSLAGAQFAMQTSTNLANWTTLFTVTNNGSVCTYLNQHPASASRFYWLVPQ